MARKFEFRKGFLKLQRLGPVKFGEQSRWAIRAPESVGLWAFPSPHFDLFYAYHRYTDLAPKHFRGRYPTDPKWYLREDNDEPAPFIEFREPEEGLFSFGGKVAGFTDEEGNWQEAYLSSEYHQAKEKWVEEVGRKILPLRTFWYSGDLYTHFNHDGTIGNWTMNSSGEDNDWTLMSTHKLAQLMKKPGSVVDFDGGYDGSGKPRTYSYSKDHLEVFIPRGRGVIRDKL